MKGRLKVLAITSSLMFSLAFAQEQADGIIDPAAPPPIPPKVPNEEIVPSVVITEKEGERIEEYSKNGRVYMVKITPIVGPAYYYFDEDGDGKLGLDNPGTGDGPVRPVYWKLKEW